MTSLRRRISRVAILLAATTAVSLLHAQSVPPQRDSTCVARCASIRDGRRAAANTTLKANDYYSKFQSNCPTPDGAPNCVAVRQACYDACGPKFEKSCMTMCEPPFQSCCHGNAVTVANSHFDLCVAACPEARGQGKGATAAEGPVQLDRKAAIALLLDGTTRMLASLGPRIPGFEPAHFDNLRRALAFMQLRAAMTERGMPYAILYGGDGRVWLLHGIGRQILLPPSGDGAAKTAAEALVQELGPDSARCLMDFVARAKTQKKFEPGDFVMFKAAPPPDDKTTGVIKVSTRSDRAPTRNRGWEGWERTRSSECATIRGTINGGGDFI